MMKLTQINELTISAYKELAVKYHESFKNEMENKEYDRLILDKFSNLISKGGQICDVGCGPSGHIGKYIQQKGFKVTGIDISQTCIEIATQYEKEIDFLCMDMMNTTFKSGTFDGILSYYSIIHTPKIEVPNIIVELNRILKPNGRLLLVVKKGIDEGIINDEWYEGNKIYFTNFIEEEVIKFLEDKEFEIEFRETRKPYNSEIDVERIYIIAKKIKSCR